MSCCSSSESPQSLVDDPIPYQSSYHTKVVFVGTSGVGKSAIVKRLVTNYFDNDSPATVGAWYESIPIDDHRKLQLWDTAGQERYATVVPVYLRGAHIAVIVYSLVDVASYEQMKVWYNRVKEAAPSATIIIVGNKEDLLDEATSVIHPSRVDNDYPNDIKMVTSALSGKGRDDLLEKLCTLDDIASR